MKPVIGIMPLWDEEKKSIWMLPGYPEGIREAGGVPLIFPLTSEEEELATLCSLCDGFLFTGGQDVSPSLYHETALPGMVDTCKERDGMELLVLHAALKDDKPVLGICRGIQFINAALGGTLYQDLPTEHPSFVSHHMMPPYDREEHRVSLVPGSPLQVLLGREELGVNSYHHQAVRELSPLLKPMAFSEDGLTEALFMPGKKYLWAVQWHPEFSFRTDENSQKIFRSFVEACQ